MLIYTSNSAVSTTDRRFSNGRCSRAKCVITGEFFLILTKGERHGVSSPRGPTWCFSTFSRWHRTLRRCLTSARTEQRTNFCCGDKDAKSTNDTTMTQRRPTKSPDPVTRGDVFTSSRGRGSMPPAARPQNSKCSHPVGLCFSLKYYPPTLKYN